jgi:S1-C subfamily serine protease
MTIDPPTGLVPPEPRPYSVLPAAQATVLPSGPVEPPRRPGRSGLAATVLGGVLALAGSLLLGHGLWLSVDADLPTSNRIELGRPGHALPLPQVAEDNDLDVTAATAAEMRGVVTIITDLYYDGNSQAAGTGSILTSDGQVLTNNHVIEGSTAIEVTVESTGKTYSATVLGTDKTKDVALLQLENASGLDTVTLNFDTPSVGDVVRSVGNALGTGDLVTARGEITSLGEQLDISVGYGVYESLENLIEVDADVVSGDSGGPLIDANGEVIGMVTAASTGWRDIRGYAVPIADAMEVVEQIRAGDESGTVNVGPTAFLGVLLADTQGPNGVTVGGIIDGTPADKAGIMQGDTITSVDGVPVFTVDELKAAVAAHEPGDVVEVTITGASGATRVLTLTLTEGPA